MLEIFGNTPPKVNIDTKMENVSPFKYGVILGSYVKFQGGNPCCQCSPNILFVQMSPFVMKLIVAGQSLYSKILAGKQKKQRTFLKSHEISQIYSILKSFRFWPKKGKESTSVRREKKYGSLERTSKSDLGSKSPNNSETPQTSLCSSEQLSTQTW